MDLQLQMVRPSTIFYYRFSLLMGSSLAIDLKYYLALESGLPRFKPGYTCLILLRK